MKLEDVLNSNAFIKENSPIAFKSPEEYLTPFLEKVQHITTDFRVEVAGRVANNNEELGVQEAYSRVLVEAKLPAQYSLLEHDSVIGIVYALDVQKPIMKVYAGRNAWACTNLAVFGAKYLTECEFLKGIGACYEAAQNYATTIEEQLANFEKRYGRMISNEVKGQDIDKMLGYLLRESITNKTLGTSAVIAAARDLSDNKSKYAIKDNKTTEWNIYSAATQYITDKVDILDKATKTVVLEEVFEKYHFLN